MSFYGYTPIANDYSYIERAAAGFGKAAEAAASVATDQIAGSRGLKKFREEEERRLTQEFMAGGLDKDNAQLETNRVMAKFYRKPPMVSYSEHLKSLSAQRAGADKYVQDWKQNRAFGDYMNGLGGTGQVSAAAGGQQVAAPANPLASSAQMAPAPRIDGSLNKISGADTAGGLPSAPTDAPQATSSDESNFMPGGMFRGENYARLRAMGEREPINAQVSQLQEGREPTWRDRYNQLGKGRLPEGGSGAQQVTATTGSAESVDAPPSQKFKERTSSLPQMYDELLRLGGTGKIRHEQYNMAKAYLDQIHAEETKAADWIRERSAKVEDRDFEAKRQADAKAADRAADIEKRLHDENISQHDAKAVAEAVGKFGAPSQRIGYLKDQGVTNPEKYTALLNAKTQREIDAAIAALGRRNTGSGSGKLPTAAQTHQRLAAYNNAVAKYNAFEKDIKAAENSRKRDAALKAAAGAHDAVYKTAAAYMDALDRSPDTKDENGQRLLRVDLSEIEEKYPEIKYEQSAAEKEALAWNKHVNPNGDLDRGKAKREIERLKKKYRYDEKTNSIVKR